MTRKHYPNGSDCVWLGRDRSGCLAAFVTAGVGPIPSAVLELGKIDVEEIEGHLLGLPILGVADILIDVPRPESFADLAIRGLYVFDWTDVHRTSEDETSRYEIVAVPSVEISIKNLPVVLSEVADQAFFSSVDFATSREIDVSQFLNCKVGDEL